MKRLSKHGHTEIYEIFKHISTLLNNKTGGLVHFNSWGIIQMRKTPHKKQLFSPNLHRMQSYISHRGYTLSNVQPPSVFSPRCFTHQILPNAESVASLNTACICWAVTPQDEHRQSKQCTVHIDECCTPPKGVIGGWNKRLHAINYGLM